MSTSAGIDPNNLSLFSSFTTRRRNIDIGKLNFPPEPDLTSPLMLIDELEGSSEEAGHIYPRYNDEVRYGHVRYPKTPIHSNCTPLRCFLMCKSTAPLNRLEQL